MDGLCIAAKCIVFAVFLLQTKFLKLRGWFACIGHQWFGPFTSRKADLVENALTCWCLRRYILPKTNIAPEWLEY